MKNKLIVLAFLLALAASSAFGQFGTATRFRRGATLPSTCVIGDVFYKNSGSGQGQYNCTAANTWTLVEAGAGDDLGSATYSDVQALWASGKCAGALKHDGTCDLLAYQPIDADLTAIAALACTENQIIKRNGAGAWVCAADATASSPTFDAIGSGTNKSAAMVIDTGASIAATGTGTIVATSASGNAGTATALAANGANCSAGNYPLGVNASGAVEDCTAAPQAGISVMTTGSGAPSAACAVPTASNIAFYWDSTNRDLYYCSNNTGPVWQQLLTDGAGQGKTGSTEWQGTTSGGAGFTVNDVAGTSILYILPATNGAAGQVLYDTGAATCPTVKTAPTSCHQLAWVGTAEAATASTIPVRDASGHINVAAEAYDATNWDSDTGAPQKDAVRDKIETLAPKADPVFTGSVQLPNSTGPTVDAAGEIAVDTTTDQLQFYGGAKRALPSIQSSSLVISAPADTDDLFIMKAPYAMTILTINGIVGAATNVVGQLQECSTTGTSCADLDSDITFDTDGAADDGTLTDSAIASGAWLKWKTTSVSGTPGHLAVTFTYRVVPD